MCEQILGMGDVIAHDVKNNDTLAKQIACFLKINASTA